MVLSGKFALQVLVERLAASAPRGAPFGAKGTRDSAGRPI